MAVLIEGAGQWSLVLSSGSNHFPSLKPVLILLAVCVCVWWGWMAGGSAPEMPKEEVPEKGDDMGSPEWGSGLMAIHKGGVISS